MDAEWLQRWNDGVDETIARIRRQEGFDGARRTWQTLGEYLRPDTALRKRMAAPVRLVRTSRCIVCGSPLRETASCDFCVTVLGIREAS